LQYSVLIKLCKDSTFPSPHQIFRKKIAVFNYSAYLCRKNGLIILDKDKLQPDDYDTITYPLTKLGWEIGQVINPIMYTKKVIQAVICHDCHDYYF